jgi:hypothetical protein
MRTQNGQRLQMLGDSVEPTVEDVIDGVSGILSLRVERWVICAHVFEII